MEMIGIGIIVCLLIIIIQLAGLKHDLASLDHLIVMLAGKVSDMGDNSETFFDDFESFTGDVMSSAQEIIDKKP